MRSSSCGALTLALTALVFGGAYAQNDTTLAVSVASLQPTNTQPLSDTLLSFSIEQDRWPDWAGIDERNDFTYNALRRLQVLTGSPPRLRVGADSEDHTTWSPTVTVSTI